MTAYLLAIVGLAIFISLKAEADRHRSAVRRDKLRQVGAKLAGVLAVPPMLTFGRSAVSYAEQMQSMARVAQQMWATLQPAAEQIVRGMIGWWEGLPADLRDDMVAQYQADRMRALQVDNRPIYDAYMWATTGRHDPPAPSGPFDEALYVDAETVDDPEVIPMPLLNVQPLTYDEARQVADGILDRHTPQEGEMARCYYCGGTYPAPVSLHHSREECENSDLTTREGYEGMPRVEGCWADVWSDVLGDYRACGLDPEGDLGLCPEHADKLQEAS